MLDETMEPSSETLKMDPIDKFVNELNDPNEEAGVFIEEDASTTPSQKISEITIRDVLEGDDLIQSKYKEPVKIKHRPLTGRTDDYYAPMRPSYHGWARTITILAIIIRWFRKINPNFLINRFPVNTFQLMLRSFEKTSLIEANMVNCKTANDARDRPHGKGLKRREMKGIHLSDIFPSLPFYDACRAGALEFLLRCHKKEVTNNVEKGILKRLTYSDHNIIFAATRVDKLTEVKNMLQETATEAVMIQGKQVFLYRWSSLTLAFIKHVHEKISGHRGWEYTNTLVNSCCEIHRGGYLVRRVVQDCLHCRVKNKIRLKMSTGPITRRLTYNHVNNVVQIDGSGPYYCRKTTYGLSTRSTPGRVKVWLLHFTCVVSHYTSVELLENFSTEAFVLAFARFCAQIATPQVVYLDSDAAEIKGLRESDFNLGDAKRSLFVHHHCELRLCGTTGQSHARHGLVERRIKSLKGVMNKFENLISEMTVSSFLTAMKICCSYLNSCPLSLKQRNSPSDSAKFLTPTSFLVGVTNSNHSLLGMGLTKDRNETLSQVEKLSRGMAKFYSRFMASFLLKNNWNSLNPDPISKGDLVLFEHNKSPLGSDWKLGMISRIERDSDGEGRILEIKYNLSQEIRYPLDGPLKPGTVYIRPRYTRRGTFTVAKIYHQNDDAINSDLEYLSRIQEEYLSSKNAGVPPQGQNGGS